MNRWLPLFIILNLWSCGPNQNSRTGLANRYYDINGLIDEQLEMLDSISPILYKKAVIDGKEELIELTPTDSIWTKELMIFRSADINKSMFADSYISSEDSNSETKTILYKSKIPKSTNVDVLTITLSAQDNNPLKIHAFISQGNSLFESQKILEMSLKNYQGQQRIISYSIKGWQKMISKESTTYHIESNIIYP